jgi:hypothetical protein
MNDQKKQSKEKTRLCLQLITLLLHSGKGQNRVSYYLGLSFNRKKFLVHNFKMGGISSQVFQCLPFLAEKTPTHFTNRASKTAQDEGWAIKL